MSLRNLKIFFLVVSFVILLALALPEYKYESEKINFRYPSIGFSKIGVPSDFGSFKRSSDLFSSHIVYKQLTFTNENADKNKVANETLNLIQDRINIVSGGSSNFSSLYDTKVELVSDSNDNYYIKYIFPEYYTNTESIARWLSYKGEVAIANSFSADSPILKDFNVRGRVEIDPSFPIEVQPGNYDYFFAENLVLEFEGNESKVTEVTSSSNSSSSGGSYAFVDSNPSFQVYAHGFDADKLRLTPLEGTSTNERYIFMNIVKAMLTQKNTLPVTISDPEVSFETNLAPQFNREGAKLISVTFLLALLIVSVYTLYKYGMQKMITYLVLLGFQLLIFTVLLKFLTANLSLGLFMGFIVSYMLFNVINWEILGLKTRDELKEVSSKYTAVSIIFFIAFATLYKFSFAMGQFNDLYWSLICFAITLGVFRFTYLKPIFSLFNHK